LVLDWKETGGPRIPASISPGYGTSVVKDLIPYELGGVVNLVFAPKGVRCRLEIPLKWLNKADRPLS
jgi:two-component sensor histidine kinase